LELNLDLHALLQDALVVAAVSSLAMFVSWLWQRRNANAGIVDITWAICLAFAALYYGAIGQGALLPRMLVAIFGAIWGFRLAGHLLIRVLHESEDGRYAFLRRHWHGSQWKFFLFFQGQVLLVLLFSVPFHIAAQNPQGKFSAWLIAGVLVWVVSIVGESVADAQLAAFRGKPANKGKTCEAGLWNYSRHPNYFFEWTHWFSYCLFAIGASGAAWALIGPATMLVTLVWVTGIPFVEAQSIRSRGEDYRRYQRSTSALIPWFKKAVILAAPTNTKV
jgi:steroid 5-alpha reductase family enzyme